MRMQMWWNDRREAFWRWLAKLCPRKLAYYCAIRLGAHATTGAYSTQEVPTLTLMETLERWEAK